MTVLTEIYDSIRELARGLSVTFIHIFRKPVTEMYPERPGEIYPRFRGRHHLQRYSNGLERCVGCALCAAACPADAIYVVSEENNPAKPTSPGERHAKVYEINMLRCIFCGFCAEACPVEAVVLRHEYELTEFSRQAEIYTKEMMLDPPEKGYGNNLFIGGMGFENVPGYSKFKEQQKEST